MTVKLPRYHTRSLLETVLPRYCRGLTADIGAGRAKYRPLIEAHAARYLTVDNIASDVQFAASAVRPDLVADVLALPLAADSLDTAICTEVLEHVTDPARLTAEMARCLKPGGHLIATAPWAAPYHPEPDDYWRFSAAGLALLCRRAGLEVVETIKKGGLFTTGLFFIYRTLELHGGPMLRRLARLRRIHLALERLAQALDGLVPATDGPGHLIVARKPPAAPQPAP